MLDHANDESGGPADREPLPQLVCELDLHDERLPAGWQVRGFEIVEELSGRHCATIDLANDDEGADPRALLGASATLLIARARAAHEQHRFSGIVRAVQRGRRGARQRFCRIRLEPAFACLAEEVRTTRFEDMTVPAILGGVIGTGLAPFANRALDLRLVRASASPSAANAFAVREACVQYGETTYDFCRRLLAEEGLSFFFEAGERGEVMVVVDDNAAFRPLDDDAIPYAAPGALPEAESIFTLWQTRAQVPERATLQPFDFLVPEATWARSRTAQRRRADEDDAGGDPGAGAIFDPRPGVTFHGYHDGAYARSDIDVQSRIGLEQAQVDGHVVHGTGNVLAFAPGRLFRLQPAIGGELAQWALGTFLITSVRHAARAAGAAGPHAALVYTNEFTCIPREVPFRPHPVAKPIATGDLAEVVAASTDDPIWTDQHGRVRVRFHADRGDDGTADRPSAWVPLDQAWAGSGYGAQVIPRAGMLVQIEYTFGDPDRPVITGCVPTGRNQLPYPLPDDKSHTAIRTRSLREGGEDLVHYNELGLDDAAGTEELLLRAGHDFRQKVLHDEHTAIAHDDALVVGGEERLGVLGDRLITVNQGETATVHGSRTVRIEGKDAWTVQADGATGGASVDGVRGDQTLVVRGSRTSDVHLLEKGAFHAGRDELVPGDKGEDVLHVTGARIATADEEWRAAQGKTAAVLAAGNATLAAAGDVQVLNQGGRLTLVPDGGIALNVQQLRIVCGRSQITVGPEKLAFRATEIVARGAKAAIRLGAEGVATTGTAIVASAVMLNELKGPLVVISDTAGSVPQLEAASHEVKTAELAAEALAGQPAKVETLQLEVALHGLGERPLANTAYTLMLPTGEIRSGRSDGAGVLQVVIPKSTRTVDVAYAEREGEPPVLRRLDLAPEDGDDGAAAALLRELGYGKEVDSDEAVLTTFQAMHADLPITGTLDAATKDAIAAAAAGRGRMREP